MPNSNPPLEEQITGILLELTGSTPPGNFAVSLAYKRLLSLYQKELVRELQRTRLESEVTVKGAQYLDERIREIQGS